LKKLSACRLLEFAGKEATKLPNETKELGQFIPLHYHYAMLCDQHRMEGFNAAISHTVKPGAAVLELGGGTGVLSFFAAQNARKVYCVEFNPELVEKARGLLKNNRNGDRVEVIHADAFEYIPPEPVDVVICEMLHVGLVREKQMEMIDAFKKRYASAFKAAPMPFFIPMITIQAIQPVYYDFHFSGYHAPMSQFQNQYAVSPRTLELGEPVIYHKLVYEEPYGLSCKWSGAVPITVEGNLNALRYITKNVLAVAVENAAAGQGSEGEAPPAPVPSIFEWYNQYLILPLETETLVKPGQQMNVSLDYPAGAPISALTPVVTGPL